MLIPIDEVVHVPDVLTHDPETGAATDADSAPSFDVFEESTDTPILDDQAMTKRTGLTGDYRGSFTASAANGFEAGKWYNVVATATVGGVTAKCRTMHFRVAPAESSAGVPQVRVAAIADGIIAAATFASGALDAVWSVATRTLTAVSDSSGVTTLLSRLSSARAGYLDNLSAGAVALEASLQGLITTIGASAAGVATAVWGAATRVLTAGTNIVLAKGTGVTGFNDPTVGAIADQVWEETLADHSGTSGSTAAALSAAGSAGDPWNTALPGAYGAGSAGKIIGDNLNATVSSRASQTSVDDLPTNAELATALGTADDAVLAAIAALNNLSQANIRTALGMASANLDTQLSTLSGYIDTEITSIMSTLSTIAGYLDTEIAAIKAKTDNLPSDPADQSAVEAAITAAQGAVTTAISALNNLSAAQVLSAAAAAPIAANVKKVNDVALTGDGTIGNSWGPA